MQECSARISQSHASLYNIVILEETCHRNFLHCTNCILEVVSDEDVRHAVVGALPRRYKMCLVPRLVRRRAQGTSVSVVQGGRPRTIIMSK